MRLVWGSTPLVFALALAFRSCGKTEGPRPDLIVGQGIAIGRPAPDIVGEDASGQPLRLADHRGKVVVLVFGAHFWKPCREMLPHERSLVQRYAGRPLALLGVSLDEEREEVVQVAARNGVTWPSWWDGVDGPIASQWGIRSLPNIFVIDHRGIIRFHQVRGAELDSAVEQLVREAEADGHS
jgi:peroxiredoxin